MLVLRRISSEGIEMNHVVGDTYTYIHRDTNSEEFRKTFKAVFDRDPISFNGLADNDTKNCYAFVCHHGHTQPLYKNQKNFMMTENGNTFANLSYK